MGIRAAEPDNQLWGRAGVGGILTPDKISQISALHSQIRRELPRRVEQKGISFQPFQIGVGMPIGGPGAPAIQPSIAGVTFDRLFLQTVAQTQP